MPNTRNCRDCDTSLSLYNGNCIRCYSCRTIHRREVFNRADKKRRRAQVQAASRAKVHASEPEVAPPVVVHRVTAKQVAAYMQAYTPKSYNTVVRELQKLHQQTLR